MKKFITLALALVMLFAVAAPAMAFTDTEYTAETSVPYELSMWLIDYQEGYVSVDFAAPETNRGYAMNEVVCAIVCIYLPKDKNLVDNGGYKELVFGGYNTRVQPYYFSNAVAGTQYGAPDAKGYEMKLDLNSGATTLADTIHSTINKLRANYVYFAFFARVTGDDALVYAKLTKNFGLKTNVIKPTLIGDYGIIANEGSNVVASTAFTGANGYALTPVEAGWLEDILNYDFGYAAFGLNTNDIANDLLWIVLTDSKWRTTDLFIFLGDHPFQAVALANGQMAFYPIDAAFNVGQIASGSLHNQLLALYNDYFVDAFGLNAAYLGNVLKVDYFNKLGGVGDLYDEVAIEPWVPYVEVPTEIVVDPPKTGDALNLIGFVMIALAGLAVVAVKKVRA